MLTPKISMYVLNIIRVFEKEKDKDKENKRK